MSVAAAIAQAKIDAEIQACRAVTLKKEFFSRRQACKVASGITELTESPYADGTVSQEQIQMRRKAEILQYRGPGRSGVKHRTSVRLVGGTRASQYLDYVDACETPIIERITSSTHSGIPGKEIFITYNPNVVLYNYKQTSGLVIAASINSPALDACYTTTAPETKIYR